MPAIEQQIERVRPPSLIDESLSKAGLSRQAVGKVHEIGESIRDFYLQYRLWIPVLFGVARTGLIAANNNLPIPFVAPSFLMWPNFRPDNPDLSILAAFTQATFLATGGISGLSKLNEMFGSKDFLEGRKPIGFEKYVLCVDLTNQPEEGTHHGDFWWELYTQLGERSDLVKEIWNNSGPICEAIRDDPNAVMPSEVLIQYLRTASFNNRKEFLEKKAQAQKISSSLIVALDRSHTVFDEDPESWEGIRKQLDELMNMNATIDTIKNDEVKRKKGQPVPTVERTPRVIIINDRKIPSYGFAEPSTNSGDSPTIRDTPTIDISEYLRQLGYERNEIINAEDTILQANIADFKVKGYKKIIVVDDGSLAGSRISANWIKKYGYVSKSADNPEIVYTKEEDLLKEIGEDAKNTAVFMLGEEDTAVASAAARLLFRQREGKLPLLPVEILMEGRGSFETIANELSIPMPEPEEEMEKVPDRKVNYHYVHQILAREYINRLLGRDCWEQETLVQN